MPRQLNDPGAFVRDLSNVTTIEQGGTNADNRIDAVNNLQGIDIGIVGVNNGIARTDQNALISVEQLGNLDIYTGPTIRGEQELIRGGSARFFITNYSNLSPITIAVNGYSNEEVNLVNTGSHFAFNVPSDAPSQLTIHLNYEGGQRDITLDVLDPYIEKPFIFYPYSDDTADAPVLVAPDGFKVSRVAIHGTQHFTDVRQTSPYSYGGKFYTEAGEIIEDDIRTASGLFEFDARPITKLFVRGRVEGSQEAIAISDNKFYQLNRAYDIYNVDFKKASFVQFYSTAGTMFEYGVEYAIGALGTFGLNVEFEYSHQDDFATILHSESVPFSHTSLSYPFNYDLFMNELGEETSYVRVRYVYTFGSTTLTSPWSDPFRFTCYDIGGHDLLQEEYRQQPILLENDANFGKAIAATNETGIDVEDGASVLYGNTLFISAPNANTKALNSGAVHVYIRRQTGLYYRDTIYPPEGGQLANLKFGTSLALNEDRSLLYIGAPGYVGIGTGAVFVYEKKLDNAGKPKWHYKKKITAASVSDVDFGSAIAINNNMLIVASSGVANRCHVYQLVADAGKDVYRGVFVPADTTTAIRAIAIPSMDDTDSSFIPVFISTMSSSNPCGILSMYLFNKTTLTAVSNVSITSHSSLSEDILNGINSNTLGDSVYSTFKELVINSTDSNEYYIGELYFTDIENARFYRSQWALRKDGASAFIDYDIPGLASAGKRYNLPIGWTGVKAGAAIHSEPNNKFMYVGAPEMSWVDGFDEKSGSVIVFSTVHNEGPIQS